MLTIINLFFVATISFIDFSFLIFKEKIVWLGIIGWLYWNLSFFLLVSFSIYCWWWLIRNSWKNKSFFSLFTLSVWTIIIITNASSLKNISGETTGEIACALNLFHQSPDFGFWQTCLFGYPARQFFTPSLISIFFGRNLLTLNFGAILYFLPALTIFAAGSWIFLRKTAAADLVTAIILSLIFHLTFVNWFIFAYEQSIFPFCLTLTLSGIYLQWIKERKNILLVLSIVVLLFLAHSYTPSLAVVFLAWVFQIRVLITKNLNKKEKWLLIFGIVISAISFISSFLYRSDIRLTGQSSNWPQLFNDLKETFVHLVFQTQKTSIASTIFSGIFLLVIIFLLSGQFSFWGIAAGLWIAGVIIISIVAHGYTYYGIDFRLHRTMIVFPIVFLVLIDIFQKNQFLIKQNFVLVIIFFFFFLSGLGYQQQYLNQKNNSRHYSVFIWLNSQKKLQSTDKKMLFFDSAVNNEYLSINDILQYFTPLTRSQILGPDCQEKLTAQTGDIFLITKGSSCQLSSQSSKFSFIDNFQFQNDVKLSVFEKL